ncbi:MAG: SAM-dependent methyltransferase [Cyclobacteriaceae bacterium]
MKNAIYLIPNYLTTEAQPDDISPIVKMTLKTIGHFLVENVRTARRFISSLNLDIDISQLQLEIMDKKASRQEISKVMSEWGKFPIGIISEAGLPGLADPGNMAISLAHEQNREVIPLPGASAIQTALICSGFDGQRFTFHGYAPIQDADCIRFLKEMENTLQKTGYTQIFMETPYRNMKLIEKAVKHLKNDTLFSISADLFGKNQMIQTLKIKDWDKKNINLHKIPAVFCLGQYPAGFK